MTGTQLVKEIINAYRFAPHVYVIRTNVDNRSKFIKGLPTGFSDLLVLCKNGRAIFIETKSKNEKCRDSQNKFKSIVENLGFEFYAIRSREEFDRIVNKI